MILENSTYLTDEAVTALTEYTHRNQSMSRSMGILGCILSLLVMGLGIVAAVWAKKTGHPALMAVTFVLLLGCSLSLGWFSAHLLVPNVTKTRIGSGAKRRYRITEKQIMVLHAPFGDEEPVNGEAVTEIRHTYSWSALKNWTYQAPYFLLDFQGYCVVIDECGFSQGSEEDLVTLLNRVHPAVN